MQCRKSALSLFILIAFLFAGSLPAQEAAPKKYALLVGVSKYEHADMNRPQPLEFPEADAKALGEVLKKSKYEVVMLLGKDATQAKIEEELGKLRKQGNDSGALMVAFFGHGVEYVRNTEGAEVNESYFCPYDVDLRDATDSMGRPLRNESGTGNLTEPDPASSISMTRVFDAVRLSKAGRRIVIADCCRNDPNAARGRSFGANVKISDLPERTAALFACSSGERAYEDKNSQHGVFTQALLDRIKTYDGTSPLTASVLGEHLEREVSSRVKKLTQGRQQQTPFYLSFSTVDLQLAASVAPSKVTPTNPSKLASGPAVLDAGTRGVAENTAKQIQESWARHLKVEVESTQGPGIEMRLIPPGVFVMGRKESEASLNAAFEVDQENDKLAAQAPAHRVTISKPFFLATYETTFSLFERFVKETQHKTDAERNRNGLGTTFADGNTTQMSPNYSWRNPGYQPGAYHPVVNVSWNDAQKFVDWLNDKHGKGWRLPTEAEWEYACRAGTTTRLCSGDDVNSVARFGNVGDGSAAQRYSHWGRTIKAKDGFPLVAPVGKFSGNAFGLRDMHGNVWEWCQDWYGDYSANAQVDPQGPKEGEYKVYRGGSYCDPVVRAMSFHRYWDPTNNPSDCLGFRVARDVR